jgi:hypothetical protein
MSRTRTLILLISTLGALPTAIAAGPTQRHIGFYREYADHFSYICMESAPSFSTAEARLAKRNSQGHRARGNEPLSKFELISDAGRCICSLIYVAPMQDAAIQAFRDMLDEYHADSRLSPVEQPVSTPLYEFDGTRVRLSVETGLSTTNHKVIRAQVARDGPCKTPKPLLFRKNEHFKKP